MAKKLITPTMDAANKKAMDAATKDKEALQAKMDAIDPEKYYSVYDGSIMKTIPNEVESFVVETDKAGNRIYLTVNAKKGDKNYTEVLNLFMGRQGFIDGVRYKARLEWLAQLKADKEAEAKKSGNKVGK